MAVAKDDPVQSQFQFPHSLVTIIDNMDVGEEVRTTDPYLAMKSCGDRNMLARGTPDYSMFCRGQRTG